MTRGRHVLTFGAVGVLVAVGTVLSACAGPVEPTGRAEPGGLSETPGPDGPRVPTDAGPSPEEVGIAPDLVHLTDIGGFELAALSVGVVGGDGMSAVYVAPDGTEVMLMTARTATPSVVACDALPDVPASGELQCSVEHAAAHVLLTSDGAGPDVLREAGAAVRAPTDTELRDLFAHIRVPHAPVERGDLPEHGDGAPDNSVGPGG